ncbi:MAG: hypothetical protein COA96_08460 [SAR86 cluster bacterium]|uniref:Peptidase S1 domain-containing protein n=1 Tax=SAR86 cluster bacterium TaxID=2030880 RepID=A0A2A5AZW8_9GAMM|nr:MAG: hypothetical protein COA96_08460 [SAR86 cluster bacterium]
MSSGWRPLFWFLSCLLLLFSYIVWLNCFVPLTNRLTSLIYGPSGAVESALRTPSINQILMIINVKISRVVSIVLVCVAMVTSQAIIIRHDVGPGRYEVPSRDFPAVFFLEQQGNQKVCVATVIHQRWALTAAHCVEETLLHDSIENGLLYSVNVANQTRHIDAVIIHPLYDKDSATDVDLALLRFREASPRPLPMPIQLEETELGETVSILGWGYFGLGTTGRQYNDGNLRRATNQITQAGRRLRIMFDDPRGTDKLALPLEGMPGLGDSGGPALISSEVGLVLAGITVGEIEGPEFSEETQGKYGSVAVYERVSQHVDWIESVIGSSAPFDS